MSSERSRKRKRQDWKDLPAFLDASASVSATTFGARRLPELKALWNAQPQSTLTKEREYQSGGGKTSSRHLRRRTTSHKPRRRHRYPRGQQAEKNEMSETPNSCKKRLCRRSRRKPSLLRAQHESWRLNSNDSSHEESVNWLTTHIWHAKRFHMLDNLFGWKVPLVHNNRGGRAALRMALEHHTLIQDVTWRMQPIVIGSRDLKVLLRAVQRICPNVLSADNPNAILSGSRLGNGMLHEPDRFPSNAIGPAMWWICGQQLCSSTRTTERNQKWWIHFFVHPAIRTITYELLCGLSDAVSILDGPKYLQGGLVCFQLRGKNSSKSIKRTLEPIPWNGTGDESTTPSFDWNKAFGVDDLHTQVPHLTTVPVQVSLDGKFGLESSTGESATKENGREYIDSFDELIKNWNPSKGNSSTPRLGNRNIVLVSQCPCDPSLPQNAATCGWDLLCHPSDANDIFQALSVRGDARAIGLVEESLACLESEPPIPVFPRDFPDTEAGKLHWDGNSSNWQLFRHCLEQGWGRISLPNKEQGNFDEETEKLSSHAVSWAHISTLPENASSSGSGTVVVRGKFGKPFVDALVGCGHILPSFTGRDTKRRPRRPVRSPSQSIQLTRLTNEEAHVHQTMCEALLQSLSLPALLRCHIRIKGKGTVVAGARILASMFDMEEQTGCIDFLLGYCVAGSFSMSRGLAHGIGFVGAARLLHVLSSNHGRLSCVVVTCADGNKRVELKVTVQATTRGSVKRDATISLLL